MVFLVLSYDESNGGSGVIKHSSQTSGTQARGINGVTWN